MASEALRSLFNQGLQAVYDAEKQGLAVAPEVADAASTAELRGMLQTLTQQGERQVQRLEEALSKAGVTQSGIKNVIAEGIIAGGKQIMDSAPDSMSRDAGIIASAQIALHYYLAAYGTLRSYAQVLGETEVADLCQQNLDERKQQDQQFTQLAEQVINPSA